MSSSNAPVKHKPKKKFTDVDFVCAEKLPCISNEELYESTFMLLSPRSTWKPSLRTLVTIHHYKFLTSDPRVIIRQILGTGARISRHLTDATLWNIATEIHSNPRPKRTKLEHINTIEDVACLLRVSKNIVVLTGAGISVSCGIPDFRSKNGLGNLIAQDYPNLPNIQSIFDINYFRKDPGPLYSFARVLFEHVSRPSPTHRFIQMLEQKEKLLRNYTQNIDSIEVEAGIKRIVQCHGSLASATCTRCGFEADLNFVRMCNHKKYFPMCPLCMIQRNRISPIDEDAIPCHERYNLGIMKPNLIFFGELLNTDFYTYVSEDRIKCDLLLVIGTSLRVHPVALIPYWMPQHVPQILINREQLNHLDFDIQLLGDADTIIMQLCHLIGKDFAKLSENHPILQKTTQLKTEFHPRSYKKKPACNANLNSLRVQVLLKSTAKHSANDLSQVFPFSLNDSYAASLNRPAIFKVPSTDWKNMASKTARTNMATGSRNLAAGSQLQPQSSTSKINAICRPTKNNIAKNLFPGTFYSDQNGIYVFQGAEASFPLKPTKDIKKNKSNDKHSSGFVYNNRRYLQPFTYRIVPKRAPDQEFDAYEDCELIGCPPSDFRIERENIVAGDIHPAAKIYLDGI